MAFTVATSVQQAACDAGVNLVDAGTGPGTLEIRDGVRPATPNDAAAGVVLSTVTLADPAFGAADTNGTKALTDPGAVTGSADGTATWFRMYDSSDVARIDGTVTATGGGGELELSTTTISIGVNVDINAGSITMPNGV